jgi:hypothetical protein
MLSRIQLFEKIRRDRRLEPDVSPRELSRRYNVHRRTVRAAHESALLERVLSAISALVEVIDVSTAA